MVYNPSKIDDFETEPFCFLSNFYVSPMEYDGKKWPTLEHAYQAMKTLDPSEREEVRRCKTPGQAKRLGQKVAVRRNWDQVKTGVMLELLRVKFRNPDLRQRLLSTGNAQLIEGNTWKDRYWGVYKGEGENWLGRLLMDVREEIRSECEIS